MKKLLMWWILHWGTLLDQSRNLSLRWLDQGCRIQDNDIFSLPFPLMVLNIKLFNSSFHRIKNHLKVFSFLFFLLCIIIFLFTFLLWNLVQKQMDTLSCFIFNNYFGFLCSVILFYFIFNFLYAVFCKIMNKDELLNNLSVLSPPSISYGGLPNVLLCLCASFPFLIALLKNIVPYCF